VDISGVFGLFRGVVFQCNELLGKRWLVFLALAREVDRTDLSILDTEIKPAIGIVTDPDFIDEVGSMRSVIRERQEYARVTALARWPLVVWHEVKLSERSFYCTELPTVSGRF